MRHPLAGRCLLDTPLAQLNFVAVIIEALFSRGSVLADVTRNVYLRCRELIDAPFLAGGKDGIPGVPLRDFLTSYCALQSVVPGNRQTQFAAKLVVQVGSKLGA